LGETVFIQKTKIQFRRTSILSNFSHNLFFWIVHSNQILLPQGGKSETSGVRTSFVLPSYSPILLSYFLDTPLVLSCPLCTSLVLQNFFEIGEVSPFLLCATRTVFDIDWHFSLRFFSPDDVLYCLISLKQKEKGHQLISSIHFLRHYA